MALDEKRKIGIGLRPWVMRPRDFCTRERDNVAGERRRRIREGRREGGRDAGEGPEVGSGMREGEGPRRETEPREQKERERGSREGSKKGEKERDPLKIEPEVGIGISERPASLEEAFAKMR